MTKKKNGYTDAGRVAKGSVHPKSSPLDRAMQRASSALASDRPADTWWSAPMRQAMARLARIAVHVATTCPKAREFYHFGYRLHLRRFGCWLLVLDSRQRPLVGPFRLPATAQRRKSRAVQS